MSRFNSRKPGQGNYTSPDSSILIAPLYDTNLGVPGDDNNYSPPPQVINIFNEIKQLKSADELLNREAFSKYGIYFDCVVAEDGPYTVINNASDNKNIFKIPITIPDNNYNNYITGELDNYKIHNFTNYIQRIATREYIVNPEGTQLKSLAFRGVINQLLSIQAQIDKLSSPTPTSEITIDNNTKMTIQDYFNTLLTDEKYILVQKHIRPPLFYSLMFKQVIEEINSCDSETESKCDLYNALLPYQNPTSGGARRHKKSRAKKSSNKKSGHKKSQNKKLRITRRHKRTRASHKK